MMFLRTSGSPPVRRSFLTPFSMKTVHSRSRLFQRQQILLGKERHIFGHAIGAAEIAAVGDRHAQVADRATKRIDHVHARAFPVAANGIVIYGYVIRSNLLFKIRGLDLW